MNLKVLMLSTLDSNGGAARAAYRLYSGLKKSSIDVKMLVQKKSIEDKMIIGPETKFEKLKSLIYPYIDRVPLYFLKTVNTAVHSPALVSSINLKKIKEINPDIIHAHWICNGFIKPEDLKYIKKPIVWRLADRWPFSGAEHLGYEHNRYKDGYLRNNRLLNEGGLDINRWVWNRKRKAWKDLNNLTIVSPSRWLAQIAQESFLFKNKRVEVIANGLDHLTFKPLDKQYSKKVLNLPQDKQIILFGAFCATSDKNKGSHFLKDALLKFSQTELSKKCELSIFGSSSWSQDKEINMPITYFGNIKDDLTLSVIYSAADIMIVPSIEESFGQTALESLSCGTPIVAFDTTGLKDVINHKNDGYLAKKFDTEDLANGINWVLMNEDRKLILSQNARKKVENKFTLEIQAKKYIDLYQSLL